MDVNEFINQPITVLLMWVKQCHVYHPNGWEWFLHTTDFLGVSFAMTTFYLFHDSVDTVCVPAPGSAMLRQLCGHWTPVAPSGCVQVTPKVSRNHQPEII